MKFIIVPEFYTNDSKVSLNSIPPKIQKEMMHAFEKSAKFKTYLEKNISDMGSVCKNKVSHYLQLKIKKNKPTVKKSFFGGDTVELHIEATANRIKKKVVSAQWCGKELDAKEIDDLFSSANLETHIDDSVKQLSAGEPFQTFDGKHFFRFASASIESVASMHGGKTRRNKRQTHRKTKSHLRHS
jgi:hypothetical protein